MCWDPHISLLPPCPLVSISSPYPFFLPLGSPVSPPVPTGLAPRGRRAGEGPSPVLPSAPNLTRTREGSGDTRRRHWRGEGAQGVGGTCLPLFRAPKVRRRHGSAADPWRGRTAVAVPGSSPSLRWESALGSSAFLTAIMPSRWGIIGSSASPSASSFSYSSSSLV
jgi:hypothetical protein